MGTGDWVLLQNCHLAKSWMPNLERIVSAIAESAKQGDPDFRLFLTSMPVSYFPVTVLQNSLKMTNEAPEGMRNNMLRSYNQIVPSDGDDVPSHLNFEMSAKPEEYKKLLFSLVYFHSIVQERRKFGALGWNIRYEFNDSDRETNVTQLEELLESNDEIPYVVIRTLLGGVNYGGRITDDQDRRTMLNSFVRFLNPEVMKDGHKFSPSGEFIIPPDGDQKAFLNFISELPVNAKPEVFGLHANADITCAQNEAFAVLGTVLSLQARVSGGTGLSRDEVIDKAA